MKKVGAIGIASLVVIIGLLGSITFESDTVSASTLYVGGPGPGNYTSIQEAIDAAIAGTTIFVYDDSAPYYENINIYKTINLVGENRSTTIIDGGGTGDVINVSANWVSISGFTVNNSGPFWDDAGIDIYSSSNNTIFFNSASNNSAGIRVYSSSNNYVINNTLYSNNIGIYVRESQNNQVLNCAIYNNTHGIRVDLSPNNIINNLTIFSNTYGFTIHGSENNVLRNNSMNGNEYNFGIEIDGMVKYHYEDIDTTNTVNGKPIYYFVNQSNIVIDETMSIGYLGFVSSSHVTVKNVQIEKNLGGINFIGVTYSTIENCTLSNNSRGVWLWKSPDNRVTNCTTHDNFWSGIYLGARSNNNIVTNNKVSSNVWSGISFQHFSENNIINNNNISNNSNYGIHISRSSNNNITYNNITDNTNYGAYIFYEAPYPSNYNVFHHNNFINNGQNAYDPHTNYWDNDYPGGGNYWSDYSGVDNFNGPNQDIPGSDGIGDTPYVIDADTQDNYPLMAPMVVPVTVPTTPIGLTATAGDGQVLLLWSTPSSDGGSPITNYRIYRGTAPGGETHLTTIGNVLMYTDIGLTNGETYYYKVSALNEIGEGPLSNEANATPVGPPSTPQNLQASAGNSYVNITWNVPASDGGSPITNYSIYRSTISGGETFLTDVGNVLYYNDTSVTNGFTYYYKVSAKNGVGEGLLSNEASATPLNTPPTCTISSPSSGAAISGTFEISGSASDTDGTVQSVEVKIDSGSWNIAIGTTSWSYSLDTTVLSEGNHAIYARSYDGEKYSTLASIVVKVNNVNEAPTVKVTSLSDGDEVSGTIDISGTAYDPDDNSELVKVEIKIDSGSWQRATGTKSWYYSWDTTTIPNGQHTIYARAYDGMNYSAEANVTVIVSNIGEEEKIIFEQIWFWVVIVIIIVAIVLVAIFVLIRRKGGKQSEFVPLPLPPLPPMQ